MEWLDHFVDTRKKRYHLFFLILLCLLLLLVLPYVYISVRLLSLQSYDALYAMLDDPMLSLYVSFQASPRINIACQYVHSAHSRMHVILCATVRNTSTSHADNRFSHFRTKKNNRHHFVGTNHGNLRHVWVCHVGTSGIFTCASYSLYTNVGSFSPCR